MMHDSRSAVSRVPWKGHAPSDTSGQSLTLHNALEHSRYPMSKDHRKDQTIAPILLNMPAKTAANSHLQQLDQIVSPLITTTAKMPPS